MRNHSLFARLRAGALLLLLCAALPAQASLFGRQAPADGPLPAPPPQDALPSAPAASQVAAEVRAGKKEDGKIAAAVAAKLLRQPNLQKVSVEVSAGVVTLSGEALTDEDRDRAATLAKQVDGVGDVVNDIQLDANLRTRFDAALNETRGITFLISTHDSMVMEFARRLITLRDGRIAEDRARA